MSTRTYTNARLFTGDRIIERGSVAVENGRIAQVINSGGRQNHRLITTPHTTT